MADQGSDAGRVRVRADPSMKKFVRVIGVRGGKFVEFEFTVNDADLTVELILPFKAFDEFCEYQNVTVLPPEADVAESLERQAWRLKQPGLLRRVKDVVEEKKSDGEDSAEKRA